jgi:uncharacterized protein YneF (UPF0154 family)
MKNFYKSIGQLIKGLEPFPKTKTILFLIVVFGVFCGISFSGSMSKNGLSLKYGDITGISVILLIITLIILVFLDLLYFTREKSKMEIFSEIINNPNISEETKEKIIKDLMDGF